jgi:hypothetical protein
MYRAIHPTRCSWSLVWLAVAPVAVYASLLPTPPDEEGDRWRAAAISGTRTTWAGFARALRAGDKLAASLLVHPKSRAEFLLKSPEDLTKAFVPVPAAEDPWICSVGGRESTASCTFKYVNRDGRPDELRVPFAEKDGVWYVTY